jgi:outer membrane protein OmpA-like peptidoglycan-associated protein
MKLTGLLIMTACVALLCGCAANAPSELINARVAYQHASTGPAVQLAPTELHRAQEALALAEKSFSKDAKSYHTRDLSYVALRKSEMAAVQASIAAEQASTARAANDYQVTQGNILKARTQDLSETRTALAVSEQSGQATSEQLATEQRSRVEAEKRTAEQRMLVQEKTDDLTQTRTALAVSERSVQATAEQLAAEQKARLEAEKRTADAQAALAKLSALKQEERGMVITLSGSVLFRTNESTLMPGATTRLDQVVDALSTTSGRNVLVEGYTDSQGSDTYNLDLSQRRADSVRDYLVHRGYPSARVEARGIGEGRPIADNATSEGRANNRRVEIILEREAKL